MVSIEEQLDTDIKIAMKNRNMLDLSVLRAIKNAFQAKKTEKTKTPVVDITSDIHNNIVRKMIKNREQSVEAYQNAGRPDLEMVERAEIAILEKRLPKMLDYGVIDTILDEVIAKHDASSLSDLGAVLGDLRATYGSTIDMKYASEQVKQKLDTT